MNRSKLKSYAPQARKEFIQAVTDRAAYYGLTKNKTEPITEQGDTVVIQGRAFSRVVAAQRKKLEDRIIRESFDQVMEAVAYTWFNRFVAIRYMELHGYLDHGYRVLSHPEGESTPEILEHAQHLDLPGLDKDKVVELKLDGTRDEELYRLLLVAQYNALNKAMPFLFERVQDESELLLPDNLLHSNSLLRKLVGEVEEEDWQEVEIIGWIYQFYISDKKAEVIGKIVKSEDIPAATQLFTPNWIVKYLVQNSIGRQWMATYPNSPLKQQMEYYIEPAEQTDEVNARLAEITPESLNPEEITLLDPACGSGHILVEGYDLFKAIYQERGYRAKDIPRLVLEKNLHGLEIDDRAAQLASFAVLMKARSDDRRILEDGVKLSIFSIQSSDGLDADAVFEALTGEEPEPLPPGEEFDFVEEAKTPLLTQARRVRATATADVGFTVDDIRVLLSLFKRDDAKTFGTLIRIPDGLSERLPKIADRTQRIVHGDDLNRQRLAERFRPIVEQAALLSGQYDAVVANPPYMSIRNCDPALKAFLKIDYQRAKGDLCVVFIERAITALKPSGFSGMVTMHSWMFLSSFQEFRVKLLAENTIRCMAHLGPRAFPSISGEVVQTTAFIASSLATPDYVASFTRLVQGESEEKRQQLRTAKCYLAKCTDHSEIPGSPLAYWASAALRGVFSQHQRLEDIADSVQGIITGDNSRYLRLWHEVEYGRITFGSTEFDRVDLDEQYWIPYNKGGSYRRWYGNNDWLINWSDRGKGLHRARTENTHLYLRPGITWTRVSNDLGVRYCPEGFLSDVAGSCIFPKQHELIVLVNCLLCSNISSYLLSVINPTLVYQVENLLALPVVKFEAQTQQAATRLGERLIGIAKADWDSFETSWDFQKPPVFQRKLATLQDSQESADTECLDLSRQMRTLEEENNQIFIHAYGLQDELSPEVLEDHITLYRPNRKEDIQRLVSYAVGCMMGRYSLDEPGLIYAHSANDDLDPSRYRSYPADEDGIIPITDFEWFDDDATNRVVEFISVAWPKDHLNDNLEFVAESLGTKRNEQPKDAFRRYLANEFYQDHLQAYKKRPIYWLFSSGKEKAFLALVYLHRYNGGTLARMRTEYVIPLQGKMSARIDHLKDEIASATSTSHSKKLEKEQSKLKKQLEELREFDEKLRRYADQRISLDLDDGVKVNYGKFGDLLAEVKAITGKKPETIT